MKKEFIERIKNLFSVELVDEPIGKPIRNFIRCKIENDQILSYFATNEIRYEAHMKGYYFVFVK